MKEHKVLENRFNWIPLDERLSRFGGQMPPRKKEVRIPVLWLACDGNELYLVNASEETLDLVTVSSGGFLTADDDVLSVDSNKAYEYRNVKPNNAVKVEEYDGYYDLDYILQVSVRVQSKGLGCLDILSPAEKGGVGETVLLWDTGEHGKHVSINSCD